MLHGVGQERLKQLIATLTALPNLTLLVGLKGSQRVQWAKYLGSHFGCNTVVVDNKIDSIRELIDLAYKQTAKILYIIPEASKMSSGAKNALLKVTEEPPQQAHFCLILEQLDGFLTTLISRGTVLKLDSYSQSELQKYADEAGYNFEVPAFLRTPGEVDLFSSYNADDFNAYVYKVINHLTEASEANALKIANQFRYKDTEEQLWDPSLFMQAVSSELSNQCLGLVSIKEVTPKLQSAKITQRAINDLTINGINKRAVVDNWILNLQQALRGDIHWN